MSVVEKIPKEAVSLGRVARVIGLEETTQEIDNLARRWPCRYFFVVNLRSFEKPISKTKEILMASTAIRLFSLLTLLGATAAPILAQADVIDELLEKLRAKDILTEKEYEEFKQVREAEKAAMGKRDKDETVKKAKAEDTGKADSSEMKASFSDGIRWESADKRHAFAVTGRIQVDYRKFGGNDALLADTFDARTVRLGASGKFWDYYSFDVTADLGPLAANSNLDVAWINTAWWKPVQLRVGQFKMPMSIDQLTSSRFIDFHERSIMNDFIPGKERGVMLHGEPTKGLFYGVAISTGQGKNNNETNNIVDSNDYLARIGVNIAEFVGQKNAVYHLAAAYSTGDLPASTTLSARTEGRGISFFASQAFLGTDTTRQRELLEASVAYGPFKAQSEYLRTNFSGSGYDKDIKAWYASLGWLITGERYADSYNAGAYGRIKPSSNFSPKGGGWGALEAAIRYSDFDAKDFSILAAGATNPGTGVVIPTLTSGAVSLQPTNGASAWSVGLKWITTPNTRFSINYIRTKFDTPVIPAGSGNVATDDESAISLRAWFDF